ncbi:MAG: cation:proton antiporter [Acidimicrobiales bacterium]
MIGQLLALLGSLLVLLAAIGVVRFGDALARMHALAKASTLGVLLLFAGAAVNLRDWNDVTSVALAGLLQVVTSPPASNMTSRAIYLAEQALARDTTATETVAGAPVRDHAGRDGDP